MAKRHLMFTYNGEFYSRHKDWSFGKCEQVLRRLGASYWEIELGVYTSDDKKEKLPQKEKE